MATWLDKNRIISVDSFKNEDVLKKKTSLEIAKNNKNQFYSPFTMASKEESFYKLYLNSDKALEDFVKNNDKKGFSLVDRLYEYYFNNYIIKIAIDFYVAHMTSKEYKLSCGDVKVDNIVNNFLNEHNFFEKKHQYLQQLLITGDVFLLVMAKSPKKSNTRLNACDITFKEVKVTEISKDEEKRIIYLFEPADIDIYNDPNTMFFSFKNNIFHLKIFSFLSEPFGLSFITTMIPYIEKYNMYDMLYMFAKAANMKKIMISIPGDNKDPLNTLDRLINFRQQFKETILSTNDRLSSTSKIDAFNQYMFTTDDIKFEYLSMPSNDNEFSLPDLENQQNQLFNLTGLPKSLFLNNTDTAELHGDTLEQQNEIFAEKVKIYENSYANWVESIANRLAELLGYENKKFKYTRQKDENLLELLNNEEDGIEKLFSLRETINEMSASELDVFIKNLKRFNYSEEFTTLLNDLNQDKKLKEVKENVEDKNFNDEDYREDEEEISRKMPSSENKAKFTLPKREDVVNDETNNNTSADDINFSAEPTTNNNEEI